MKRKLNEEEHIYMVVFFMLGHQFMALLGIGSILRHEMHSNWYLRLRVHGVGPSFFVADNPLTGLTHQKHLEDASHGPLGSEGTW